MEHVKHSLFSADFIYFLPLLSQRPTTRQCLAIGPWTARVERLLANDGKLKIDLKGRHLLSMPSSNWQEAAFLLLHPLSSLVPNA